MNKLSLLSFGVVIMAMAAGCEPTQPPDLIARIHFAGAERISANTNSIAFTNLFCSAEARALESQTLDKLSRAPATWFKSKIPPGAGDGMAQLRPLLDDVLKSEWVFEIRDTANGSPEYALAIRLNSQRAQLWQSNLQGLLESWTRMSAQKVPGGWQLKKHEPPNLIRVTHASGDWVVVDCGQNQLTLVHEILNPSLKRGGAGAETNWLTADLDWPRLGKLFPALARFDFPKLELQFVGLDGDLWANGKFILAQPLPPLEPWRMPTNIIHQPLVSFTAVRGIGPWLARQDWARPYEIQPPPDQFFIWGLLQIPFQTFAATPVPNAASALAQLDGKLSVVFDGRTKSLYLPPITTELTNNQIGWRGVPFAAPFVRAWREPAGDFLFGGFFPNTPRSQPLPPELFQQLSMPNLVYYHWEVTATRLKELPQLTQLLLLITHHKQFNLETAAGKWLGRVGPTLGSSVTEITQTGPNELNLRRVSRSGLTALEIVSLVNWLEAANFPGCDLRLPPPPPLPRPLPKRALGVSTTPPLVSRPAPVPPAPPH